ncbi:MAG: PaaI family thioesterase [Vicinamibacterales bacterium]
MTPRNPNFRTDIERSFARQGLMQTLGASLLLVEPGHVTIEMPFADALTQQNGFAHAGALAAIADNACGYAALSLAPADHDVLAVEFKINLLAPGRGESFQAAAHIVRAGRTLTVIQADVFAIASGGRVAVATLLETAIVRPMRSNRAQLIW